MIDRIAAQLYTLHAQMQTVPDITASLKRVSQIGYPAVQVSGLGPIDPTELKKIIDGFGLEICATHTAYEDLMDKLPEVIKKHQLWQCSQIAVPVAPVSMRSEEGYIEFGKQMTKVGQELAKEEMTLSYHNHAFEMQRFNGKMGLDLIYDNSDSRYFQGEIDTYWIQFGGGDPVLWCEKLSGRLPLLHLKDFGIIDNKPTYMEIGEGNLNWSAILDAARKAGTQWYIVEQDVCAGDPIDSLKISYDNCTKLFNQLN